MRFRLFPRLRHILWVTCVLLLGAGAVSATRDSTPAVGDPISGTGVRPDEDISSKEKAKSASRRWIAAQAGSAGAPAQPGHEARAE